MSYAKMYRLSSDGENRLIAVIMVSDSPPSVSVDVVPDDEHADASVSVILSWVAACWVDGDAEATLQRFAKQYSNTYIGISNPVNTEEDT